MPSDTLCYSFIAIKGIRNTWNLADSFQDSITKIQDSEGLTWDSDTDVDAFLKIN